MITEWNGIHHSGTIILKKKVQYDWKEIKDVLSGMHLDYLITLHPCKAKPYLLAWFSQNENEWIVPELFTQLQNTFTKDNEIFWNHRCPR